MNIRILIILLLLLGAQTVHAQYDNADLLLQSPDGKTVKLIWFIKKWNSEITGFDVKRKEGLQDWVKLNKEPILPEISSKKKLAVVESDKIEEGRIKSKLYMLLTAHDLQETDNKAYLQKLNADDKAVQEIAVMIAHDYDLALMNGFAYVDHTVTRKTEYTYGLFIQGTDVMLDSIAWNYGEVPDLNLVTGITSRSAMGKNGIQLIWNVDQNKMKNADVAGFNVYREGIRLNAAPIVAANSREPFLLNWNDLSANSGAQTQYSISAESLFGIEGVIKSYRYDPADHPKEYKKAVVTEIVSKGYYFKEGISLKWTFPREAERFIKGFYVEKDNMPGGYKRVSGLLDPVARSITDTSASQVSGYMRFRIVAMYNDRTQAQGVEKVYNYFPVRQPPVPQNVKAKSIKANNKVNVYLNWDSRMSGDSVTDHYRVYVSDTVLDRMIAVADKPRKNSYTYTIDRGAAFTYKFCVSAANKADIESALSDTVYVKVVGTDMPVPTINVTPAANNAALVQWSCADVAGLRGFRLLQNNATVATEKELGKSMRQYTTAPLPPGTYAFSIQAIADDGTAGALSSSVPVTIKTGRK